MAASGVDTAYVVTPIVGFGIKELHFFRTRASRGFGIYVTIDTLATTTEPSSPAFSTIVLNGDSTAREII